MAGQLIFQPPTFHWPSEDQQTAYEEWRSPRHPCLRSVQCPPRQMVCKHRWFPGHRRLQEMDPPRHLQKHRGKEESRQRLPSLRKHSRSVNVPVELHRRDVPATYDRCEQETTDQLDQRIKILVEKCGYQSNEEKERRRLELLFHATKHFEVKKWVRSQTALKRSSNFRKTVAARKTTRGNRQRLQPTQVQRRSRNVYHHQRDQNVYKERSRISSQSPYQE